MRKIQQFNFNTNGRPTGECQVYGRTWKEAFEALGSNGVRGSFHHFRNYASQGHAIIGKGLSGNCSVYLGATVTMEEVEQNFPKA
jgi:hypothetical protein